MARDGTIGGSIRVPVAVAGGLTFSSLDMFSIDSLHSHVCGLTTSGVTYCRGDNQHGQLGNGTNTDRYAPTPVAAQQ